MKTYYNTGLLILAILVSRLDQADPMNLLFIHLPNAWLATATYIILTLLSLTYLLTKNPYLIPNIHSLFFIGTIYTLLTLITGTLWGKMTWGKYWVWDGRIITVLILLLFYLISYKLYKIHPKTGAIITIIGALNLPLIKYSVEWWTALHQGASETKHIYGPYYKIIILWTLLLILYGNKWRREYTKL